MKIQKQTGKHNKRIHEQNIQKVKEWFLNNPEGFQKDCARDLSLSTFTVNRIVQKINRG